MTVMGMLSEALKHHYSGCAAVYIGSELLQQLHAEEAYELLAEGYDPSQLEFRADGGVRIVHDPRLPPRGTEFVTIPVGL